MHAKYANWWERKEPSFECFFSAGCTGEYWKSWATDSIRGVLLRLTRIFTRAPSKKESKLVGLHITCKLAFCSVSVTLTVFGTSCLWSQTKKTKNTVALYDLTTKCVGSILLLELLNDAGLSDEQSILACHRQRRFVGETKPMLDWFWFSFTLAFIMD